MLYKPPLTSIGGERYGIVDGLDGLEVNCYWICVTPTLEIQDEHSKGTGYSNSL